MSKNFTKVHYDFESLPWLTSPRKQLELQGVALGLINIPANEGYTFTHTHRKQEEVYIVISGSGSIQINDDIIELVSGDIIRVAPEARRALKADEAGLFIICSGAVPMGYPNNPNARYLIDDGMPDYDDIPPWYTGNKEVLERNIRLKERMNKGRTQKKDPEKTSQPKGSSEKD